VSPFSTIIGRPDTVIATEPSLSLSPGLGIRPTIGVPVFSCDVGREIGVGRPKRTVPRVMISDFSVWRVTVAVIADGFGAAVSAAICAGDLICFAATQATTARSTTPAKAMVTIRTFLGAFIGVTPCVARLDCTTRVPTHDEPKMRSR
jgi:hypothetical protein